jgi:hypothetical protein
MENCLFVNIKNLPDNGEKSIRAYICYAWRIGENKQPKYICAMKDKKPICVFEIKEIRPITKDDYKFVYYEAGRKDINPFEKDKNRKFVEITGANLVNKIKPITIRFYGPIVYENITTY